MSLASSIETSSDLLSKAVHRNARFSVEGMLERAFTRAFSGLVYPQIWEDPVVDMKAMQIKPSHHVVAIASGGCNVLSYLTANPRRITAVDLNHSHVVLNRLKLAGLAHLPCWKDFYSFFGEANAPGNASLYDLHLRRRLDPATRSYWDKRSLAGRRRISQFKRNFYRNGLLGRFIGAGHIAARSYGCDPGLLLSCTTQSEQEKVFEEELAPLFDKRLVRWITGRKASLYGLGIPPAQYEALAEGRHMADVLRERLRRLATGFPLDSNYFAWQAFGRRYAPYASGAVPPYLQRENFEELRQRAGKVEVMQASITDVLNAAPAASIDRVVLLDAQDWMTDEQLNALWSAITRAAAPATRVIFRTAGVATILPGRVKPEILSRWSYLEELSLELGAEDRSSIYGGFHVYELG